MLKIFLYVDDLVTGEESEEQVFDLYFKSKEIMELWNGRQIQQLYKR